MIERLYLRLRPRKQLQWHESQAAFHSDHMVHAQTTWSTLCASTYWNMRLSAAGAAKDAQVQNDILLSDFTRNLVVVGRQPHPDPNIALCVLPGRPHRLAVALPRAA